MTTGTPESTAETAAGPTSTPGDQKVGDRKVFDQVENPDGKRFAAYDASILAFISPAGDEDQAKAAKDAAPKGHVVKVVKV